MLVVTALSLLTQFHRGNYTDSYRCNYWCITQKQCDIRIVLDYYNAW